MIISELHQTESKKEILVVCVMCLLYLVTVCIYIYIVYFESEFELIGPGRCDSDFKSVTPEYMLWINFMSNSYEIALRWMPRNTSDDKSTLIYAMAWCSQTTSITWANIDPDLWCHIASLGHNELNRMGVTGAGLDSEYQAKIKVP